MNVAIIDYIMSNLHSVQAACKKVGLSSVITSDKGEILDAKVVSYLVLERLEKPRNIWLNQSWTTSFRIEQESQSRGDHCLHER